MKTILNFIKKNRNIILLIISFVFLTMLILGMTYAYFDLKTGGETESTMTIGGAEISATYSFSNSINITDALPGNDVIAYKDITLTYKNTSSEEYKVYLKTVIDYSTFTNTENDGVLYYDIYSGTDHSTLVQDKIDNFEYYIEDTDLIVIVQNVPTNTQLSINCKGKDIEIEAERIINEDLDSILSDLQITTDLKEIVASILFSEEDIKKKRINIRKLRRKGLHPKYITMFLKLLEYIAEL